jgi:hypothetical protein
MTRAEQETFVRELSESVINSICDKIGDGIPAEWDGHELRRYIADKFEAETTNLTNKRNRDYKNAVLVNNL